MAEDTRPPGEVGTNDDLSSILGVALDAVPAGTRNRYHFLVNSARSYFLPLPKHCWQVPVP